MSFFSRLSTYHTAYNAKFYNKKFAGVGIVIGAWCGLTYLAEFYGKKRYNTIAHEWNSSGEEQLVKIFGKKSDEMVIPKLVKYKNPFSLIIIPSAPYSVNILTTMITGGGLGYLYAVYFPVTIPATIVYNLATYDEDTDEDADK